VQHVNLVVGSSSYQPRHTKLTRAVSNNRFFTLSFGTPSACDSFDFRNIAPDQSYDFYYSFFSLGMSHGMTNFELDFVDQNLNCMDLFQSDIGAAEQFLTGMATAAYDLVIPIQWCFSSPSSILQSLLYPSVTNFRVSHDYYYGNSWDIGLSSLLVWAVNGAPSTDTFWTSDNGNVATTLGGCPAEGCPPDHSDAGCELHTLLAVVTTGPVGFSDAINHTNVERILRTCRADGVLLRPSKPVTAMDTVHRYQQRPGWKLLQTYSGSGTSMTDDDDDDDDDIHIFAYYIVAHHLTHVNPLRGGLSIPLGDLWPRVKPDSRWFVVWNGAVSDACVTNQAPARECGHYANATDTLVISTPTDDDFQAVTATIVAVCPDSDWVLLGELVKYVSLSTYRFSDIECLDSGFLFKIHGSPGEVVTVSTIHSGMVQVHTHKLDHSQPTVIRYNDHVLDDDIGPNKALID
jgi:hypothetical protein